MTRAEPAPPSSPSLPAVVSKDGVDLRRPLVRQMADLGDAYDAWVHDPVGPKRAAQVSPHVEGTPRDLAFARRWPESLRMFQASWLEHMSHIPWWSIPLVWIPIAAGLAVVSVVHFQMGAAALLAHAAAGLLVWTLTEYLFHRFAFHYRPSSRLGRRFHFILHGVHHLDPWDRTRLVFPPVAGIAIMGAMFALYTLALPVATVTAGYVGLLLGYVTYDMTHYYTHHGRPKGRWGRFVKAWHLAHHHKAWNAMYGVSSPLWDFVFRTVPPEDRRGAKPGDDDDARAVRPRG